MSIFKFLCCLLSVGLLAKFAPGANAFSEFSDSSNTVKAQPSLNFWASQKQKNKQNKTENFLKAQNTDGTETFRNAQSAEELKDLLEVREIPEPSRASASPSSSLGIPTGFGAQWGNAWIGGAYGSSRLYSPSADGSISFGMGFGDARKLVGLEVFTGIFNLSGDDDSLGGSAGNGGAVGFKLHRLLDDRGYFSAGVGMANVIRWGGDNVYGGGDDTYFGVVTGRFDLQEGQENPLPLIISAGLGSGAFRSMGALNANEQNVNVFGSVALRVIPEVSLISTWTGSQLNMGTSLAPFHNFPLVLNLGAGDVTGAYPQGTRFIMSLGYGIRF
ncbi:MAG: hypothetical protein DCF12_19225 [Snowella sp.]|nr:MAG: hypothetical protein DCF12_19225 [Snowella sp.]